MKKYNIFQAVYLSFFSADFYQAVAQRWRGIGFWYLFLLVLVATLPMTVRFWIDVSKMDTQQLKPITSQIPRIEIRNGQAKVDAPQPIYVQEPDSGKTFFIIATKGKIPPLDQYDRVGVLTKTKLIIKQPGKLQAVPLKDVQPLLGGDPVVIDQEWVEGTILWWANVIAILCFPVVFLFSFIYRFIELFILGIIGLLIVSSKRPPLSFAQVLRISAMALTPVIVINTIYESARLTHPFGCVWWILCIAVPILYLTFGIRAAYRPPPSEEHLLDEQRREEDDQFFGYDRGY